MSYSNEILQDIRDYSNSWVNTVYGWLSICHKCGIRNNNVMRLETGRYQCIPCVVKFNESGILDERHTFICLICGRYYYEHITEEGKTTAMLHCPDCREIDRIIKKW